MNPYWEPFQLARLMVFVKRCRTRCTTLWELLPPLPDSFVVFGRFVQPLIFGTLFCLLWSVNSFDGVGSADSRRDLSRNTSQEKHCFALGRLCSFALAQVSQVMRKGYCRQHFGVEWLASQCCPFLFKAPVVAVPDNSPKEVGKDDGLM